MDTNTFTESFKNINDFRQPWKIKHRLIEVIFTAVVATIANANTWIEVEAFVEAKEEWFKKFISLENGIPSHDTYERVFENLDSEAFNSAFIHWTSTLSDNSDGRVIAIDGKTSRRSHDGDKSAIHIVNAWVDENDLILGQLKTFKKSNEITAIPELLDLLFIKGSIITIDAMGTQKKIAEKIIEKEADYVLALKGNHGTFSEEVKEYFEDAVKNNFKDIPVSKKVTIEKGHGRIEKREYFQTDDIEWFVEKHLWKNLSSIGMVRRTVTSKGRETVELSYFISSLKTPKEEESELFSKAVRNHWGVESCHWILDVVFREDHSRVRKNNGAANQSMLKKIALNILKQEKTTKKKTSLKLKRFKASIDESFLTEIISGL
jgi:predicted transposase YbfD/YdcC